MLRRFLLATIFVMMASGIAHSEMVSIVGEQVNMRAGPGTKYAVLWQLGRGFPLRVLSRKGNWLRVVDFEKDGGWVFQSLTARTPYLIVKAHKNSKARINIRSGPGINYRIVGKAYYGVVFKTLEKDRGWVKVRHENGLSGWVKRSLLWGW